ncbi:MAG TPA: hypothetical protein VN580_04620 [Clostridia bacterium]|nr:hypothetical protein [Clostridia bacterium]
MQKKFTELRRKIEKCGAINVYDLLGELTEAYEKGEIDCSEYNQLNEFIASMKQEARREQ